MPDETSSQNNLISSPNLKALKLYVNYMWHFRFHSVLSLLFSLTLALRDTLVPLLIALTLGQWIKSGELPVGLLILTGCVQLVLIIAAWLLDRNGVAKLHQKMADLLYEKAFVYLVHQDYSFFANRFSGALVTQASRFAKSYSTFNDVVFFDLVPQVTAVLIAVSIMIFYSPLIGVLTLLAWLISLGVVVGFGLQRLPLRRSAVAKESEQVGELADVVTNALTVKTFAAEDIEAARYDVINKARGWFFLRSWHRAVRNAWIVEVLCALLQMMVLVSGILAMYYGKLEIATFLLFQVYALRIIDNIRRGTMIVRQLEVVSGDAQEMAELLEQPPFVQNKAFSEQSAIRKGVISIDNIRFKYDDVSASQEALFENFTLDIAAGEKIGLVGPSGGGKTTITRLLLRFMDVQGGSIKIDGQDIRDIKQQDLRRAIAYVPQEPLLFHRSIKDNIRYGQPDATDEEIISVAKKSFAHAFIKTLPEGYNTLVGERGVKLSGGQRQRVAIARAMLTNAPVLILDEATSALDSESERVIQKALWELMKDKTAVVIAHRLSTIQRMDRIIVLDEGRIIEQGTHKKLLENDKLYARLWSHQSGGFIEE